MHLVFTQPAALRLEKCSRAASWLGQVLLRRAAALASGLLPVALSTRAIPKAARVKSGGSIATTWRKWPESRSSSEARTAPPIECPTPMTTDAAGSMPSARMTSRSSCA